GGSGKTGAPNMAPEKSRSEGGKKWWRKVFSRTASACAAHAWRIVFATVALLAVAGGSQASLRRAVVFAKPVPVALTLCAGTRVADRAVLLPAAALPPQGQFSTGQAPVKITDGTNTLVVDPCKGQTEL